MLILAHKSIGILGILMQNAAYAVIVPIYLIIYLSTSPLVSSDHAPDFLIHSADVAAIPLAIVLGYGVPAVMMSLPAPSIIDFQQKQTWMAIWQVFPLWVAGFQAILSSLISRVDSSQQSIKRIMTSLRFLYLGLLIVAAIGQLSTITLMSTSSWFPDLFATGFRGVFDLKNVFLPVAATPSVKMPSIGAGLHLLLQYDQLIGSTSMLIFATVVYALQYQRSEKSTSITTHILYAVFVTLLSGPLGYAVACIWARDELVVAKVEDDDKKND